MFKWAFIVLCFLSGPLYAELRVENYTGVAKDKKGNFSYEERHHASFDGQKIQTAKTEYVDADGKTIGELSSDFRKQVSTPEYQFKDLRHNLSHGIVLDGDKYILWKQDKGGPREEKVFLKSDFKKDVLVFGCQGLHYYLIDNLSALKERKDGISIKYMMPGKLDYYSFTLKLKSEDADYVYLKLTINSIFLKLFAPSLDLKYRKSDNRLVDYSGLSNITDAKDKVFNVDISYKYN
jgi:hypothetical protein